MNIYLENHQDIKDMNLYILSIYVYGLVYLLLNIAIVPYHTEIIP